MLFCTVALQGNIFSVNKGEIDGKFLVGFFSCGTAELIIDSINGFSLSEVLYSPPVTGSGGHGGVCHKCFLAQLPFLRNPEQRSSVKGENRVCIWVSAHCGARIHLRTPHFETWRVLLDPTTRI